MYRLLIVDDEPIMIKALEKLIKSMEASIDIVATAKTGREAIEKVHLYRPDILITDIKMPGINGLEAIRQIKMTMPNIYCVVLSAFDYFEYATEAVALGVDDYLLKPVKDDVFKEALLKGTEAVDRHREKLSLDLKLQEDLELMRPIVEASFFNTLRGYEDCPEELNIYSRIINGDLYGGYALSFLFIDKVQTPLKSDIKRSVDNNQYYQLILDTLMSLCPHLLGTIIGNRLFAFVFVKEPLSLFQQKMNTESLCHDLFKKVEHLPLYKYCGIGQYYSASSDVKSSYLESIKALQVISKNKAQDCVLHAHDLSSIEGTDMPQNQWHEDQLYGEVARGHIDSARFVFDEWFKEIKKHAAGNSDIIKGRIIALLAGFNKFTGALNAMFYEHLIHLLQCSDSDELQSAVYPILRNLCLHIPSIKEKKISKLVEQVDHYIADHFDEDITLEEISKSVNLSPFYFSRLYKDETGTNFITKLIEVRIEKAKQYLLEHDISIKELSSKVGYPDANYFSKLFKKSTGYTPTAFKECFRK